MGTPELAQPALPEPMLVGVTGATGYVGGRLVRSMLDAGYRVRCIVREPRKLDRAPWSSEPGVSIAQCDLAQDNNLADHLRGCSAVYCLIHSIKASGKKYAGQERCLAWRFVNIARGDEAVRCRQAAV